MYGVLLDLFISLEAWYPARTIPGSPFSLEPEQSQRTAPAADTSSTAPSQLAITSRPGGANTITAAPTKTRIQLTTSPSGFVFSCSTIYTSWIRPRICRKLAFSIARAVASMASGEGGIKVLRFYPMERRWSSFASDLLTLFHASLFQSSN